MTKTKSPRSAHASKRIVDLARARGSAFALAVGALGVSTLSLATGGCQTRAYNTDIKAGEGEEGEEGEDSAARGSLNPGILKHRDFLARYVEAIREEIEGSEDFTWDIDCPEVSERFPLKFNADSDFRFDLADGSPARVPSLMNAVVMARASFLTYKKSHFLIDMEPGTKPPMGKQPAGREPLAWGFTHAELVSDATSDVQAFVFSNDTVVLVVFRGTASLIDVIVDLDLIKAKNWRWGETHRGFTEAYKGKHGTIGIQQKLFEALHGHGYDINLWRGVDAGPGVERGEPRPESDEFGYNPQLDVSIKEHPSKQLWLTGHSAGGALAQLLAADITERETLFRNLEREGCTDLAGKTHWVAGVVSFGAPRVGDGSFKACMDAAMPGRNWRYVSDNDIVPQIPWVNLGYAHAGENLFLNSNGKLVIDPPEWDDIQRKGLDALLEFTRSGKAIVSGGVADHFLYPQPIQHQFDPRCSHKRGEKPDSAREGGR